MFSLFSILFYKLPQWEVLSFCTNYLSFLFPLLSLFCSVLLSNYLSPLSTRAGNILKTLVDNAIWNVRKFWNFLSFDFGWTWFYPLGSQMPGRQSSACERRWSSPLGHCPEKWIVGQVHSPCSACWKGKGNIGLSSNYNNQLSRINQMTTSFSMFPLSCQQGTHVPGRL